MIDILFGIGFLVSTVIVGLSATWVGCYFLDKGYSVRFSTFLALPILALWLAMIMWSMIYLEESGQKEDKPIKLEKVYKDKNEN